MLVLTRKSNQSIMIGDDIEVSVLAIMGEKVRIGIEAPRKVPVFRKEAAERSRMRRAQRVEKRGNMNFTVLVLVIVATTIVVTIAMFQTLSLLIGS